MLIRIHVVNPVPIVGTWCSRCYNVLVLECISRDSQSGCVERHDSEFRLVIMTTSLWFNYVRADALELVKPSKRSRNNALCTPQWQSSLYWGNSREVVTLKCWGWVNKPSMKYSRAYCCSSELNTAMRQTVPTTKELFVFAIQKAGWKVTTVCQVIAYFTDIVCYRITSLHSVVSIVAIQLESFHTKTHELALFAKINFSYAQTC